MEFDISITSVNQLNSVINYNINKLYIPYDLFYSGLLEYSIIDTIHQDTNIKVYMSLPRIIRMRDEEYLSSLKSFLLLGKADGILVKNLEALGFLTSIKSELENEFISLNGEIEGYTTLFIDTDSNLYTWNSNSLNFNRQFANGICAPTELTIYEISDLKDKNIIIPIYQRTTLMVSANCIKKTSLSCNNENYGSFAGQLSDRMKKQHIVFCNCLHCYNEIFNAFITSYHKQFDNLLKSGFHEFKIDFTNESDAQIRDIMDYYTFNRDCSKFPLKDYTQGHIIKGTN